MSICQNSRTCVRPRPHSDVTICPVPTTRANSFDKQVFPKFEYLSITIELVCNQKGIKKRTKNNINNILRSAMNGKQY